MREGGEAGGAGRNRYLTRSMATVIAFILGFLSAVAVAYWIGGSSKYPEYTYKPKSK